MQRNTYEEQKKRGQKRKLEVVLSLGGCCSKCGYDKNLAAFDFHHKDPKTKSFGIDARKFANTSISKLKEELDKCVLLCANCHREEHHPNLDKENYSEILQYEKSTLSTTYGKTCPVCNKVFKTVTGKTYCSKTCRESLKNYPSKELLYRVYAQTKSWEKVAQHFGITRKITQNIRKK